MTCEQFIRNYNDHFCGGKLTEEQIQKWIDHNGPTWDTSARVSQSDLTAQRVVRDRDAMLRHERFGGPLP